MLNARAVRLDFPPGGTVGKGYGHGEGVFFSIILTEKTTAVSMSLTNLQIWQFRSVHGAALRPVAAGIVGYYVICSAGMLEGDVQIGYNGQKGLTSGAGGKLTLNSLP